MPAIMSSSPLLFLPSVVFGCCCVFVCFRDCACVLVGPDFIVVGFCCILIEFCWVFVEFCVYGIVLLRPGTFSVESVPCCLSCVVGWFSCSLCWDIGQPSA